MPPITLVPTEMAIVKVEKALVTEKLTDHVVLVVNLPVVLRMVTLAVDLLASNIEYPTEYSISRVENVILTDTETEVMYAVKSEGRYVSKLEMILGFVGEFRRQKIEG
jgi:hypothetical protein